MWKIKGENSRCNFDACANGEILCEEAFSNVHVPHAHFRISILFCVWRRQRSDKINKRSIYSDDVKYIGADHQRKKLVQLYSFIIDGECRPHFINSLCIRITNKLLRPHPIHHLSYSYLLFIHNLFFFFFGLIIMIAEYYARRERWIMHSPHISDYRLSTYGDFLFNLKRKKNTSDCIALKDIMI